MTPRCGHEKHATWRREPLVCMLELGHAGDHAVTHHGLPYITWKADA